MKKDRRVDAGHFYGRDARGRLHDVASPPRPPDVWICRRLEDFPGGSIPSGGAAGTCTKCGAVIVFNPLRVPTVPSSTPKVCMQCESIQPDPL